METAIVKGEIQTLPTPFWYFVPRNGVDLPEIASVDSSSSATAGAKTEPAPAAPKSEKSEKSEQAEMPEVL